MRVGKFYLEIYPTNYRYFIGEDTEKVTAYVQKHYGQDFNIGESLGMVSSFNHKGSFMVLIYIKDHDDIITLAHEAAHAAAFTLHNFGIHISTTNHEALTYLMDMILGKILKHIKKLEKKCDNKAHERCKEDLAK